MGHRLAEHWIWDFWTVTHDDLVHAFFLQAPRSLADPELRHHNATIGHATSRDLRTWTPCPDALATGPAGTFDDRATWTGSILRTGDGWVMAYTGICEADDRQRIGFARSADLATWTRCGPVLEADPRWYEDETWRDPWLFRHDGALHMLVTARARTGPVDGRGVIAHARLESPGSWEIAPPITDPGDFATLEVPQLAHVGGRWRLLFSAHPDEHSAARLARTGLPAEGGTHVLSAAAPLGPFVPEGDGFMVGDPVTRHYAGRLVRHDGRWHFLAWRESLGDEVFLGELADPMDVHVAPDGRLAVAVA
jgi:beta-fructofuranosidase